MGFASGGFSPTTHRSALGGGFSRPAGSGVDADATAFLTASGNNGDATISTATRTFVTALKGLGLWTKTRGIWPIVGGTAAKHKWNLKDPRDLDAAGRLNIAGSWTHSANGMIGDGATAYADTFLLPSSFADNDVSVSIYSRTDVLLANGEDFGAVQTGSTNFHRMFMRTSVLGGSRVLCDAFRASTDRIGVAVTDSLGLFTDSVIPTGPMHSVYKRGALLGAVAPLGSLTAIDHSYWIGADNNGAGGFDFSARQYSFIAIGSGLTDTEAANLHTAVQAYQTSLGRAV